MLQKLFSAAALVMICATPAWSRPAPADLVLLHGDIHTSDAAHPRARALAVRGGRLVYVGSDAGAGAYVGPATMVEDADGRVVLPGLVDAHVHPTATADLDVCNLASEALSLDALVGKVAGCVARYHVQPGQWLAVNAWNFTDGNAPSAANPSLRAALDHAAPGVPVMLMGNDGHHGATNSAGLALAHDRAGTVIGLSAKTLAGPFAALRPLVGLDASGEPNGTVNEDARDALGAPDMGTAFLPELMKDPAQVSTRFSAAGITAMQDAWVTPEIAAVYDALQAKGQLNQRVSLLQLLNPEDYARADGSTDFAAMVAKLGAMRAKYRTNPLIRAEGIKIFADGVMEGNPYAVPPTQPESPSLAPLLQPIFARDAAGKLTVTGYADTASPQCVAARAGKAVDGGPLDATAFQARYGYHPGQCAISFGRFQHDPALVKAYAIAAHEAGFTLHIHAISDAAVRLAVDAIEAARAAAPNIQRPDTIAHLQQVTPQDVARIGRDHLFLAYTYSWMTAVPEYDISVVPFYTRVAGNSYAAMHDPNSAYERQFYPVVQTQKAGAVLVAGSDAPVGTPDPQPFVNMVTAVTRSDGTHPPANPAERISIEEVVSAYTIDGARALGRAEEFGSLAMGKSGDFILLDRDIFALAKGPKLGDIAGTKVLATWFRGRKVFSAESPENKPR